MPVVHRAQNAIKKQLKNDLVHVVHRAPNAIRKRSKCDCGTPSDATDFRFGWVINAIRGRIDQLLEIRFEIQLEIQLADHVRFEIQL